MVTRFIDTHCHLERLALSPENAVLDAAQLGVSSLITISVEAQSFPLVEQLMETFPQVYGTFGIHPHEASSYSDETTETMKSLFLKHPKSVAVGETGLDYHYLNSEKHIQCHAFEQQLILAHTLDLPLVLHSREAEEDTLAILKNHPLSRKGVAHSFTGSQTMAIALVDLGWYIGVNGILTFKTAESLRSLVKALPLDRILLETDSPYLAPIPFRGQPNDPSKIPIIAQFLAQLLGISIEVLAEITSSNAHQLFHRMKPFTQ